MKTTNTQQKCTGASVKVANVESVIETLSVGVKSLEQIKINNTQQARRGNNQYLHESVLKRKSSLMPAVFTPDTKFYGLKFYLSLVHLPPLY